MSTDNVQYYCATWGYEQTNVSFYKVLKRTEKTVTVIEVNSKKELTTWGHYIATPTEESPRWAKAMRRKIQNYTISKDPAHDCISINSFSSAYPWDGEAVAGTCYA